MSILERLELRDANPFMSQIAGAAAAIVPAQGRSITVLRGVSHYGDGAARSLPDEANGQESEQRALGTSMRRDSGQGECLACYPDR